MYYKKLCRKDKKYMSENGQLTAKKPLNNNVSNGNINFNGIIAGAKRIEEEQNEKFKNDMQEMARKERERADKIESLLLKAHEKTEEERKRKMEEEQKAAEEKARVTYEHLMDLTKDEKVLQVLAFLRQREIVHFDKFKELYDHYIKLGYKHKK